MNSVQTERKGVVHDASEARRVHGAMAVLMGVDTHSDERDVSWRILTRVRCVSGGAATKREQGTSVNW